MKLWEILVPHRYNDGRVIMLPVHKEWDNKVATITGGLTIMHSVKGAWRYNDEDYNEKMIPVRIACTKKQLEEIVKLTLKHYAQISVMAYLVSNEVIFFKENFNC